MSFFLAYGTERITLQLDLALIDNAFFQLLETWDSIFILKNKDFMKIILS